MNLKQYVLFQYKNASTILESAESLLRRIPMSRFISGKWGGHEYVVEPADWRSWVKIGSFAPPYMVGDKVRWRIEINKLESGKNPLRGFPIYQVFPPYNRSEVKSHQKLKDVVFEFIFDEDRVLSSSGEAQFWLGEPGGESSLLLISIDVIADDKISVIAISAVIGAVVGAVVALLF